MEPRVNCRFRRFSADELPKHLPKGWASELDSKRALLSDFLQHPCCKFPLYNFKQKSHLSIFLYHRSEKNSFSSFISAWVCDFIFASIRKVHTSPPWLLSVCRWKRSSLLVFSCGAGSIQYRVSDMVAGSLHVTTVPIVQMIPSVFFVAEFHTLH